MFSRRYVYPAVGLFSTTHLISVVVLFFAIFVIAVATKKMSKKSYIIVLRVMAIIFTCLELVKIIWNLNQKNVGLDEWVPLYFCSLFIYALWLSWFKSKKVQELGLSFICFGGIVAGVAFIIFPTTSFNFYPIFHFQSIYSMLFHSSMVYAGIMCVVTKSVKVNINLIVKYCLFSFAFMLLALGFNLICGTNLMFISNPSAIPLPFLHSIYKFSNILYMLTIVFSHTILIGFGMAGIIKIIEKCVQIINNKKSKNSSL